MFTQTDLLDTQPATTQGTQLRRLWLLAGGLLIAHIVMMFGGLAFERTPILGDSTQAQSAALVHSPMTQVFAGGYVETLSFLTLLVALIAFARLLRGRTEVSRLWASAISATGSCYVAITIACGFAAGAAATYDGHHGAPLPTVIAVNDVRNFAYFLSVAVLGLLVLCIALAVRTSARLPRWVARAGYIVAAFCMASVPAERHGVMDLANMVAIAWLIALAVFAIRHGRRLAAA
jgi:hypothetical protein